MANYREGESGQASVEIKSLWGNPRGRYLLPALLFFLTFVTTTIAGVFWQNKNGFELENFHFGLAYSLSVLFILGSHEFGHFFAARHHKVSSTLPFFIPFPPLSGLINFGTFGALIRTRSPVPTRKAMFDIGVAGPIAGFFATIIVLSFGFLNLPPKEFLYSIHPEYALGAKPGGADLIFGNTLLLSSLANLLATGFVPPMDEIYHYPFLCAGWLGLLVTAMNLIPVGQLDGGHISYAMFGDKHRIVSRVATAILLVLGLSGLLPLLGFEQSIGWTGWLFWAFVLVVIVKLDHPPIPDPEPIGQDRLTVGWAALAMLVLSFSPSPISLGL